MKVFMAIREGISAIAVVGVFTSPTLADEANDLAKLEEPDNYHTFDVVPLELDQRQKIETY